ncbi:MAG: hypothetical protein HYW52_03315 [Gemmatimonadetes bacterium]|nr:hypothetical protein [Gemmatimonadota bacterium]
MSRSPGQGRSGSWRAPEPGGGERGVSLIEIVLAQALLSVVLVSLTGLMYQVQRHARSSGLVASRSAAAMNAAAWAQAIPFDSIPGLVGWAAEDTIGEFVSRRYMSYETSGSWRIMTIVVNPEGNSQTLVRPETLTVVRAKAISTAPLKIR